MYHWRWPGGGLLLPVSLHLPQLSGLPLAAVVYLYLVYLAGLSVLCWSMST